MGKTKRKLQSDDVALGGWIVIGHPTVAEIMAGEGFDWIAVDMEHTSIDIRAFHEIALAVKGTGVDLLARLPSNDPVVAKRVLDLGANGIIVPTVNTADEAQQAVAMAKFPPEGIRGASLSRATDFGRNFADYFQRHNSEVIVVVMLEHLTAVNNADAILATPGITAAFIGPYDLSASMQLAGQLDHPDVQAAQRAILEACKAHGVPAGIHVVSPDPAELQRRISEGFRFLACAADAALLLHGCRTMLKGIRAGR